MIELLLYKDYVILDRDKTDIRQANLLANMWRMHGRRVDGKDMILDWKKITGKQETVIDDDSNKLAFGYYSAKAESQKIKAIEPSKTKIVQRRIIKRN